VNKGKYNKKYLGLLYGSYGTVMAVNPLMRPEESWNIAGGKEGIPSRHGKNLLIHIKYKFCELL
jgi:hypothetical protein